MKIICATDFTPGARAAARVAIDLARRTAGSVELLYVTAARTSDIQALTVDVGVFEYELREGMKAKLAVEAQELAGEVPVTFHLGEGDVDRVLLACAKEVGADLIVMGSRGHTALRRLVLGSAADRMVRCTDLPVMIVPPGIHQLGRSSDGKRTLRIVAAIDGRPSSEAGIAFLRRLRAAMPCDVTFLRLYWAAEEYLRLGLTGARELAAPDPAVVSDLGRALRMQVGVLPGIGKTHYAVEPAWGDPAFRIFAGAIDHDADLIVMGSESRHGWARLSHPPVASHVARDVLEVPVVFVPPAATQPCQAEVPRIFTVLAPTDLSATGSAAVPFAYTLAAAHGGVVELCHVHERALADPPYAYDRSAGQLSAEERTRLEAALRALVPSDAERLGITTHVTVIDGGKAAQAIVQAGERFVADAIVVGSHGKGGALRSLLGSVSHDVVRQARRPVLVVPSPGAAESNHAEGRDTP